MSVYVVKDADIGLQFNFPEPGKFDIPIIAEFKLLNDKFEKRLSTRCWSRSWNHQRRCADFDANAMFKYEQLYSGKYSLEIVNRDSFEFEAHPRDNRPMEKMKYSDFAIIANTGVRVPCHKMVLEDLSTVLDERLQMECPETPENCMKMEASEDVVKAFLKYLYYTDVRDACDSPRIATELLELAHVYDVTLLEKAMKARKDKLNSSAVFQQILKGTG
ncbi:hypothetical protein Ocin01_19046, partial [Orchesella cincta]